jgi:hypothetical protein
MLSNIVRLTTRVQPFFSSSLDSGECATMSLGVEFLGGIFLVNPPFGNFLHFPKNGDKGAFMFEFVWILIVIQSTLFPSTTSAYTIRRIERGHSLRSRKGFS